MDLDLPLSSPSFSVCSRLSSSSSSLDVEYYISIPLTVSLPLNHLLGSDTDDDRLICLFLLMSTYFHCCRLCKCFCEAGAALKLFFLFYVFVSLDLVGWIAES